MYKNRHYYPNQVNEECDFFTKYNMCQEAKYQIQTEPTG